MGGMEALSMAYCPLPLSSHGQLVLSLGISHEGKATMWCNAEGQVSALVVNHGQLHFHFLWESNVPFTPAVTWVGFIFDMTQTSNGEFRS